MNEMCLNRGMRFPITLWFTKNLPCFVNVQDSNEDIEVLRIPAR